jgi:hypothetical protein
VEVFEYYQSSAVVVAVVAVAVVPLRHFPEIHSKQHHRVGLSWIKRHLGMGNFVLGVPVPL